MSTAFPPLFPSPAEIERLPGELDLVGRGFVLDDGNPPGELLQRAVDRLFGGSPSPDAAVPLRIDVGACASMLPSLAMDEAYRLRITREAVCVEAGEPWGALRALALLQQFLAWHRRLPCLAVEDAPRFPWRGLMLDPARHFLPAAALHRSLDGMALVGLNVLHLHLSDDQGFRFPSHAFPELVSADAYSGAELAGLVDAAAERGIRVVPELDVPGHVTAWLVARPDWGVAPVAASDRFGVHDGCLDVSRPEVLAALDTLIGELAALFPDPFVHLGGDEVKAEGWRRSERVQRYRQGLGLADERALQQHFFEALRQRAAAYGRRLVGWDEVLAPGIDPGIVVQAWRGVSARDAASRQGCDQVLSAPYYLDLNLPADWHHAFDPAADESALLALEDAMLEDPRFAGVASGMAWTRQWREQLAALPAPAAAPRPGRLLGAEACLWGELVDAEVLDTRLWSRLPVLAERFWSPPAAVRRAGLHDRLQAWLGTVLPGSGIDLRASLVRRLEALGIARDWWPLIDWLEPVKWYARLLGPEALASRLAGREMPLARPYRVGTPLDRLVDALPPQSLTAAVQADRWQGLDRDSLRREGRRAAASWRALAADAARARAPVRLEGFADDLERLAALLEAVAGGAEDPSAARERLASLWQPRGEIELAACWSLHRWLVAWTQAGGG